MEHQKEVNLHRDLTIVLNRYRMGDASSTPTSLLADHLLVCLASLNEVLGQREKYYGRDVGDACMNTRLVGQDTS